MVYEFQSLMQSFSVFSFSGCSYFASQTLAAEAQIVFCPYSYIINPIVRRAMDIDIKGSIVILDEAQYGFCLHRTN